MLDFELMDRLFKQAFDRFDWERVEKIYASLEWKWFLVGIPKVIDLQETVRSLYKNLRDHVQTQDLPFYAVTTGGLELFYSPFKGGTLSISMVGSSIQECGPAVMKETVEVSHPTNYVKEG